MSYIGNNLTVQQYAPTISYLSGNGSTTAFTLPYAVVTAAQIIVSIENVIQNPSSSFTVSGTTITFTSAPPSGTNNIWVEYTSLQTNFIQPANGSVSPASLSVPNALYWDTSSNVGIGTTTPTAPFTVNATTNNGTAWFKHNGGNSFGTILTLETTAGTDDPSLSFKNYNGGSPTYYGISGTDDGSLAFKSGAFTGGFGTERMRISSGGTVTMPYQPAFSAYFTNGSYTTYGVLPLNQTYVNIGNNYNTSTYRFTAPIAGTYLFTYGSACSGANYADFVLFKNGTQLTNGLFGNNVGGGGVGYPSDGRSIVLNMASGDYVTLNFQGSDPVNSTIRSNYTVFSGHLIG